MKCRTAGGVSPFGSTLTASTRTSPAGRPELAQCLVQLAGDDRADVLAMDVQERDHDVLPALGRRGSRAARAGRAARTRAPRARSPRSPRTESSAAHRRRCPADVPPQPLRTTGARRAAAPRTRPACRSPRSPAARASSPAASRAGWSSDRSRRSAAARASTSDEHSKSFLSSSTGQRATPAPRSGRRPIRARMVRC